jgi:Ca2+-transporting ATPase
MQSRDWHSHTPDELETTLQSNLDKGLTEPEGRQRLANHGPNELPEAPPVSALTLLIGQFTSVIIWVLIGAAVISGLLQEWVDAAAILAIVLLNAALGFVQEYRAEQSIAALKNLSITMARVIREGVIRSLWTANVTDRCYIEVRWWTRPMVCFVNVQSVEWITFSGLTWSNASTAFANIHKWRDITPSRSNLASVI